MSASIIVLILPVCDNAYLDGVEAYSENYEHTTYRPMNRYCPGGWYRYHQEVKKVVLNK